MPSPILRLFFAFAALIVLAGCTIDRSTADVTAGTDLRKVKVFYVVKLAPDERGINNLIKTRLTELGYKASTGPNNNIPEGTDVVVTYADKWMWDITMYMLELTITFREPDSSFPMAVGNSYHTSFSRLSPEEMVDEVLRKIFGEALS